MEHPHPSKFVGFELTSTFGKREAESMAQQIVAYCADVGNWDVPYFQLERLARLADLVESEVFSNGGLNNRTHERGLRHLMPTFIEDLGMKPGIKAAFVERLAERTHVGLEHPIVNRCHKAVVEIFKHHTKEG